MSKKEKRIAAQEEKAKLAEEKRVIAVAKILGHDKTPIALNAASAEKQPVAVKTGGIFDKLVTISSEKEDRDGSWSWHVNRNWHLKPGAGHVNSFTELYHQKKSWREVFEEKTSGRAEVKKKHVSYKVTQITKETQKRLIDIEMDDQVSIFRFRMANLERLYGFIVGSTFITVWFDPTHEIYPMD